MKSVFVFLILNVIALQVWGQNYIEPCKYGQDLVNAVRQGYYPSQSLGYNPGRDILYSQIDNVGNDLYGVYTNFKVTLNPAHDPSVSAYQSGAGLNAEHVYPQSKGAGNEPMKSDLHNIYPAKVNVNSARGNCPFDDIPDANTDTWYFEGGSSTSIPSTNIDAYSEKDAGNCEFEPRESKKGDIARAVFYFYTMYQAAANNADANFFHIQKAKLLEWHYNDLPDSVELARSAAIASFQGNVNPFAMDTSLARRAYFMPTATYPVGNPGCMDVATNVRNVQNTDWVKLRANYITDRLVIDSKSDNGTIEVINLNGQIVKADELNLMTSMNLNDLITGLYFVRVNSEGKMATFKIFVE